MYEFQSCSAKEFVSCRRQLSKLFKSFDSSDPVFKIIKSVDLRDPNILLISVVFTSWYNNVPLDGLW